MKVSFQADAEFNQNIVRAVRRHVPAIDFQTARQAGFHCLDDQAVLAHAVCEGRILVSHDCRMMPGRFANFIATGTSAGVILISQDLPIMQAVEGLILIWEASEAEESVFLAPRPR
jgi:hypothetical protein